MELTETLIWLAIAVNLIAAFFNLKSLRNNIRIHKRNEILWRMMGNYQKAQDPDLSVSERNATIGEIMSDLKGNNV